MVAAADNRAGLPAETGAAICQDAKPSPAVIKTSTNTNRGFMGRILRKKGMRYSVTSG